MNLGELRTLVSRRVGFNEGTPDQDFDGPSTDSWKWIDEAINDAYEEEVAMASREAGTKWLQKMLEFTWPASQLTQTLPAGIEDAQIIALYDVTANDGRGDPIWMGHRLSDSAVTWRDFRTLEWRDSGPPADATIRVFYVGKANTLAASSDVPDLFPERHHRLIGLSAAVILRMDGDEAAPREWIRRRDERRHSLWKELSKSRPYQTGPRVPDMFVSDNY